jgi:hypothetical protein
MKKILFLVFTLFVFPFSLAQTDTAPSLNPTPSSPPFFCKYGKVRDSFTEPSVCTSENVPISDPLQEILNMERLELRNQYMSLGYCKSSPGYSNDNFDDGYIEVEVGKYLLIGNDIRVKGNGSWLGNGNGARERVEFYDSVSGYKGYDRTNSEGNAYLTYNLNSFYNSGPGQVWVINREYYLACSKKDVYFQRKPYIGPSGFTSFNIINGSMSLDFPNGFPLYYEVDWNSKAVRENVPSTITLYARYETSGARDVVGTVQVSQQRGTVSIRPSGYMLSNGKIRFYAQVNDGTHSSDEVFLGTFTRIDTMPSACAQVCPASLGLYRAQCQGTSGACNYRTW